MTYKTTNGVTVAHSAQALLEQCRPVKPILITLKCSHADKSFIQRAAKLVGQTVSAFVRRAAEDEAHRVSAYELSGR